MHKRFRIHGSAAAVAAGVIDPAAERGSGKLGVGDGRSHSRKRLGLRSLQCCGRAHHCELPIKTLVWCCVFVPHWAGTKRRGSPNEIAHRLPRGSRQIQLAMLPAQKHP